MTPKEKAHELVERFLCVDDNEDLFCDECGMSEKAAKLCALIAVDEILKAIPNEYLDVWQGEANMVINEDIEYWQEVKTEIQKL